MRLALVQMNPTIGDFAGNVALAAAAIERSRAAGADLVLLPELAVSGYPPRDLLLQEGFVEAAMRATADLARLAEGLVVLAGAPWAVREGDLGAGVTNSLMVLRAGSIAARYDKRLLPTYDVFDEDRYFVPGDRPVVIEVAGMRVGLSVCEDLWRGEDAGVAARYHARRDPVADLINAGAQVIVNPSASPFTQGKGRRQRAVLAAHARRHGVAIAAVNQVGGNDELVFDGHAVVYVPDPTAPSGARTIGAGPGFREDIVIVDLPADPAAWATAPEVDDPLLGAEPERLLWEALVIGVRDYCRKTGFKEVVLGLSGGIDSSLTACIAAAALGPGAVLGVRMPSRHSSDHSMTDASALAERLGVQLVTTPIERPHAVMEDLLQQPFRILGASESPGVAEENIQSRLRGLILMAFSNKLGTLLLTTGNKSELAVGYCTLYGDMNGGLAVLADVTKVQVYSLSRWINANAQACGFVQAPIPESVLTKPPSAELRPNQTDQDTLPPYEVLDDVIERHVGRRQGVSSIVAATGYDAKEVGRIIRLIDGSEYKRRQAPVGLKVTDVAFGTGRRLPIANGWRPWREDS